MAVLEKIMTSEKLQYKTKSFLIRVMGGLFYSHADNYTDNLEKVKSFSSLVDADYARRGIPAAMAAVIVCEKTHDIVEYDITAGSNDMPPVDWTDYQPGPNPTFSAGMAVNPNVPIDTALEIVNAFILPYGKRDFFTARGLSVVVAAWNLQIRARRACGVLLFYKANGTPFWFYPSTVPDIFIAKETDGNYLMSSPVGDGIACGLSVEGIICSVHVSDAASMLIRAMDIHLNEKD